MAKDASFDIVSEVSMEEVKNAIQQSIKELTNRFDFKGSTVEIKLENNQLVVVGDDDFKIEQIKDVLLGKLNKRNVPIKNIHFSDSKHALGGKARQTAELVSGIDRENAKKITTEIKNSKMKVKAQIQEDQIRVTGKNRDDLQAVISLLRKLDLPIELQFTNYR
ncbi:YajQ family cyclic di-GMP-binding protein [Enterococcus durans]|uniref:Nucleotide-binding protein F6X95_12460 n=1 Tax=Enterococcus durans TaxID=53345 RepID=A0A5N0YLN5_9ENTE|nr:MULTISPECIES: YajQ family cyclic di-GMP-binding protein [Enterococcus]KAA9178198.1 YajQ family cyclic di-GMP-binding protein [Enterococcus durans]KAA9182716.1 YajQ family cyclic di-GMP-binding protein [Enterococcus durans]KAA9185474.1 YajQ family cyclic di-GMP-binding protein [Enterococcus durans]KAA9189756.1 YajQ family cyclic di-GMP-binding protein [Enterococcus durans]KAA9190866.1 YajQ family cyclic di-GMP-binding protein [Enterococcus durans]